MYDIVVSSPFSRRIHLSVRDKMKECDANTEQNSGTNCYPYLLSSMYNIHK